MNRIVKIAFVNSLATTTYIILIASFLFNAGSMKWGQKEPTVLIPILMLSLFVLSASITGSLILGRPILWYLEGKKKEALLLLGYTLGIFFLTTLIALGCLIFIAR